MLNIQILEERRLKRNAYARSYRLKNREKISDYAKKYRQLNSERFRHYERNRSPESLEKRKAFTAKYRTTHKRRIHTRVKEWQRNNPEKVRRYKEKWRVENMDKVRAAANRRYANNPSKAIASVRRYQKRHPERATAQRKRYRENNRDKVRLAQNAWQARQMSDVNFRIKKLLRGRTHMAIRAVNGAKKSAKTIEMLGCSITDFRIYLESKFETGMTWENYGKVWHVDHIMPCAIFDLTKSDHQKRCFHFSNMQPLFKEDNLRKNRWHVPDQFNLL